MDLVILSKTIHFIRLSVKFDDRISLHIMADLKRRDKPGTVFQIEGSV